MRVSASEFISEFVDSVTQNLSFDLKYCKSENSAPLMVFLSIERIYLTGGKAAFLFKNSVKFFNESPNIVSLAKFCT